MNKEELEKQLQVIVTQHQQAIVVTTKLAGIAEFIQGQLNELKRIEDEKTEPVDAKK